MNLTATVQHHGYAAIVIVLLLSSCGLPMPLSVVLLAAGAAAHGGVLSFPFIILCGAGAGLVGDTMMFFGGRTTGWWLLAGICRFSINPEACIHGSAKNFYRRGAKTLLFSKFVPGLATIAAPLAGSLNMRLWRFLRNDSIGVLLYVTVWSSLGYVFAGVLHRLIAFVERLGQATAGTLGFIFTIYAVWLTIGYLRDTKFTTVQRVAAHELFDKLNAPSHDRLVVIADVRSHGYYDPGMQRIKNSIRVEPTRLRDELVALREFMQPECEIYLYCSCAHEATSVRVAKMLERESCHTKVIQGGLKAWIKAGGPLEPVPLGDVEHLPRFD
jgi:membrane protein DedA with SNARE-associated domain/rhodanese-related sulfurtransferase